MEVRTHGARRVTVTTRRLLSLGVSGAVAAAVSLVGCSPLLSTSAPTAPLLPSRASSAAASVLPSSATASVSPSSAAPAPAPSPGIAIPARSAALPAEPVGVTPLRLRIPAIGVDTSLVRLGLTSTGALDVPTRAMTAGWYTGSPVPGRTGPAIIAGHVHWSGVPAVFARLAELGPGDAIVVVRSDRTTVTFTVDRVATYAKTRFPTALVYGSLDVPGLRLITCGGYDPVVRAYEANVIVFATVARA